MEFDDLELKPFGIEQTEDGELQRTKEWLEDRRGNFTGSKMKDLMSCGRSTAKLQWGTVEKLIDFGRTAEKYIYNVGKERLTGLMSQRITSKQMYHGIIHEPLLIEKLLEDGVIENYKPCKFKKFKDHNGGASPDGTVVYQNQEMGLETKCCVSWDGHFARCYDVIDEKHDDFWQFQTEMMALEVDKLLYVVASPMTIEDYEIKIIDASPIHQKALLQRILIADAAIGYWDTYNYSDSLKVACAKWEE